MSAKILQREQETGFRPPKEYTYFLIRAFRTCERATLECRKGHSCAATVALLQARLGPFSPVFGLQYVSVKFKRLIISVLEKPLKSRICTRAGCRLQISQAQRPKTKKWFNKIFCPNISPQYIDRAGKAEPGKPLFSSPAV